MTACWPATGSRAHSQAVELHLRCPSRSLGLLSTTVYLQFTSLEQKLLFSLQGPTCAYHEILYIWAVQRSVEELAFHLVCKGRLDNLKHARLELENQTVRPVRSLCLSSTATTRGVRFPSRPLHAHVFGSAGMVNYLVWWLTGHEYSIVFVHGLNGHPKDTWTSKSGVFWPADLLPDIIASKRVRILTYGYNASVVSFTGGASTDRLHHHAEKLAADLIANRSVSMNGTSPNGK
jgi:hypothetical protein